jgi:hypothetical protein
MLPSLTAGFDSDIVQLALSLIRTIAPNLGPDRAYDAYRRRTWEASGRDRDAYPLFPTSRAWFDRAADWVRTRSTAESLDRVELDRPLLLRCRLARRAGIRLWRTSVGYSQEPARAVLSTEGEMTCSAWVGCLSAALATLDARPRSLLVPSVPLAIEPAFLKYCRSAGLRPMLEVPA